MKVGIVFSAFDLLHPGHILMLRECKEHCDYLIACLHVDPSIDRASKNKPIQTVYERFIQLEGCKYVDKIVPYAYETEIPTIIRSLRPNIRFIGEEYKDKEFTGLIDCKMVGTTLYYNMRKHSFSTTELRDRIAKGNTK